MWTRAHLTFGKQITYKINVTQISNNPGSFEAQRGLKSHITCDKLKNAHK